VIKQFLPEGVCLKCKGCCRFLEAESVWLAGLLNEEVDILVKDHACKEIISAKKKIKPFFSTQSSTYICSFLAEQENKCKIYPLRPLECQLYPFLINYSQENVWLAVDFNCPFVADHLDTEEFKDYAKYLDDLLSSDEFKKIFKTNPQIIQSYPHVRNLTQIIL